MHASVSLQPGSNYVVTVRVDDIHGYRPFANFGWCQGAAMETRDLINSGRIKYERVYAKIRMYDPKVLYGRPRYRSNHIEFPRRSKHDGETIYKDK